MEAGHPMVSSRQVWRIIATTLTPANPDDRIAQLLADGDPSAIELLYDRYGRLAYTLAFRVLGDPGAAEDVVQDAFLSVWRRRESFDAERGSIKTWMAAIVHHRALDRLRGRSGRSRRDLPLETAGAGEATDDSFDAVAEGLERDQVRRALASLSPDQRSAIELAYYGGLSQSEISERLGIPLGTVKGRTRQALRRLREVLTAQGMEWAM
jgi:RNA polymerase sigma-70 factor (ECF subfamily)